MTCRTLIIAGARGGHGATTVAADANGNCGNADNRPGGVENIYWSDGSAPSKGRYVARVALYDSCRAASGSWRLVVRRGSVVILDQTGTGSSNEIVFTIG